MHESTYNVPRSVVDRFKEMDTWLRERDRFALPPHLDDYVKRYIEYKTSSRTIELTPGHRLYRARIHQPNQSTAFLPSDMGAPPMGSAASGRLNPEGMSFLYLADSEETAVSEVRPWVGARISLGSFIPLRSMKIATLMHPNSTIESDEITQHGMGLVVGLILETIYFSAPTHREDRFAYLPTQYIAAKFRAAGVDGLQYASVLNENGVNTALFDPHTCCCEQVKVVDVRHVQYNFEHVAT